MRHLGGHPLTREDSWRRLACGVGLWPLTGLGMWAVERRVDGRFLGQLGFFDFQRDIDPSLGGEPEMGWIFASGSHGQGFAREACEAALEWIDREIAAPSIPAIIDLDNLPSMKLAERLGFERQDDASYHGNPISLWRRRRG